MLKHAQTAANWPYDLPTLWPDEGWLQIHADGLSWEFRFGLPLFWSGRSLPALYRRDNEFWLKEQEARWLLAGLCLATLDDIDATRDLLRHATGPVALWLTSRSARYASRIDNADAVEVLSIHGATVSDISCLDQFPRLRALYLDGTRVTDLSPLRRLSMLKVLSIAPGEATLDLRPLDSLEHLRFLELVRGDYSHIAALGSLTHLESLLLPGCTSEEDLALITSRCLRLTRLACHSMSRLRRLPDFDQLSHLVSLDLRGARVDDVSALQTLRSLASLDLALSERVRSIAPLARLVMLEQLELWGCGSVNDVSPLCQIAGLRSLSLPRHINDADLKMVADGCAKLERVVIEASNDARDAGALAVLKQLRELRGAFKNLNALPSRSTLRVADVRIGRKDLELTNYSEFSAVRRLSVRGVEISDDCARLTSMGELESLSLSRVNINARDIVASPRLVDLAVTDGGTIENIAMLGSLRNLCSVCLRDAHIDRLWRGPAENKLAALDLGGTQVRDLSPLADASQLSELNLANCAHLDNLSVVGSLPNLRSLILSEIERRLDLSPLSNSPRLARLALDHCPWINDRDIQLVSQLRNVVKLELGWNDNISDLSPLTRLPSLEELDLIGCTGVKSVRPLAKLRELRSLCLSGCEGISDFRPIGELTNLVELLLEATNVRDIAFVKRLPRLRYIDLTMSHDVDDITPLIGLRANGCVIQFAERHDELVELDRRAGFQ